jgi:oxygen-independent coproporphyrinogen III oxidase
MDLHSLYLHIPFCVHRCAYCDFNTYAGMEDKIEAYTAALCHEMELVSSSLPNRIPIHTIFFGGGTPTLLPKAEVEKIFYCFTKCFDLQKDAEITLEANPGTVSLDYLKFLRGLGANRLSFGMQSADEHELALLTRQHSLQDVVQAVEWARIAGFTNLNLDLIFGLPGQSLQTWQATVEAALALAPDHLSLYALTIEKGTPMQRWVARGLVQVPDDDTAADMYDWCSERLEQAGWRQYEISNWATRGADGQLQVCRHNLQYWLNRPYLGFGAGAHGYAAGIRTADVNGIQTYIGRIQEGSSLEFPTSPANVTAYRVERNDEMAEMMMVGLRLTELGVSNSAFQARFGISLEENYAKRIRTLTRAGLLEWTGGDETRLRLTKKGRLLGNRVFREFV